MTWLDALWKRLVLRHNRLIETEGIQSGALSNVEGRSRRMPVTNLHDSRSTSSLLPALLALYVLLFLLLDLLSILSIVRFYGKL
jgi:hypothetical protein